MGTARIDRTTIESAAYDNVFALMNNRSNIADPRASSASGRPFIVDSDPLAKGINFGDFPYVVLQLPTLEYTRDSINGKHKFLEWKHMIIVRTVRSGSGGNKVDTGRSDMLAISDDLQEMFNSISVRQQFLDLNMSNMKLTKIDTDTLILDQDYLYEATYELTYNVRLTIST